MFLVLLLLSIFIFVSVSTPERPLKQFSMIGLCDRSWASVDLNISHACRCCMLLSLAGLPLRRPAETCQTYDIHFYFNTARSIFLSRHRKYSVRFNLYRIVFLVLISYFWSNYWLLHSMFFSIQGFPILKQPSSRLPSCHLNFQINIFYFKVKTSSMKTFKKWSESILSNILYIRTYVHMYFFSDKEAKSFEKIKWNLKITTTIH